MCRGNDCRWLDPYMPGVCRNEATHPARITAKMSDKALRNIRGVLPLPECASGDIEITILLEPPCRKCDGCGYEQRAQDAADKGKTPAEGAHLCLEHLRRDGAENGAARDNERGAAPNPGEGKEARSAQGRDTNAARSAQGRDTNAARSAQGRDTNAAGSALGRGDRGKTPTEGRDNERGAAPNPEGRNRKEAGRG